MRRLLLTFSTLLVLSGLYSLYHHFVSPLFAPVRPELASTRNSEKPATHPRVNKEAAEMYLKHSPWAADASYQVRTDEGTCVFAEEWQQVEPTGEVRLKPFAMIWRRDGDPADKEPITIVSDSALVRFVSRVDFSNPHPGRLVGGALEGDVQVRGGDGLSVQGKNFIFSESALRVWSDHPVSFAYGQNRGSGHGLELDLLPETVRLSADKPGVSGLRTVRLRRNVSMDLQSDPRHGKPNAESVRITSAGTFEFSVEAQIATFQDEVLVVHPTGPNQVDKLQCDLLTLIFEQSVPVAASRPAAAEAPATPDVALTGDLPPRELPTGDLSLEEEPEADAQDASTASTEPPHAGPMGLSRNLAFRRLRGEGKVVTLISQRSDLRAEMTELTYDAQSRVATMQDGKQVRVFQKNNEIFCPEITVEHSEHGRITKAICRGAGRLNAFTSGKTPAAQRGPLAFAANWLRQLQKYSDPAVGLDVIEFEGQARLRQPGQMDLAAEIVRVWITGEDEGKGDKQGAAFAFKPAPGAKTPPVDVKRLLALQQVAFTSPQLVGKTERLEVWFEEGTLPQVRPDESGLPEKPPARPVRGAVPDKPAPVPAAPAAKPPAAPPAPKAAPQSPPVNVKADLIRLRVIRDHDKSEAAEVWNEGSVHVTQARKPGEPPFDLVGERLHLRNYSEQDQVLRIVGKPAQVKDGTMQLEGPEIHVDRAKNSSSVIGPGMLRLPANNALDGKPLDKPQTLDVWWHEQMQFDGEIAIFYADVKAMLGASRMKCQEMQVTFSQKLSFSDRDSAAGRQVQVLLVNCKEGVEIENPEYAGTKLIGIQKANAWELSLSQTTGDAHAQGPGSLVSWRRGNGKRAGLTPTSAVQANRPLEAESVEWEYTRIDFAGAMKGNVAGALKGTSEDRVTTFTDRVRIVYGPVERTTDTVDPDALPKDGGWMRCDALRLRQHAATSSQAAYIDMLGTGNSELDGRSFHAKADSISFDESKKLYLLQSRGNQLATIWRQSKPGVTASPQRAQRMEYSPIGNQLRLDRATGLNWLE